MEDKTASMINHNILKKIKSNSIFVIFWILPKKFLLFKLNKLKIKKYMKLIQRLKNNFYYPDTKLFKFIDHTAPIHCVSFSPNDEYFASGSADKSCIIYGVDPSNLVTFGKKVISDKASY